jgi:hypothetical protein
VTTPVIPPQNVGQIVYLGSQLVQGHYYGVITDGLTPDQFSSTWEVVGDQGTLITAAIKGDQGDPGENAFALRLQTSIVDDPANLPGVLTNSEADIGKYWLIDDLDTDGNVIGSSAYIWFGSSYRRMMMGSPGPAGPVPRITWHIHTIDPEDSTQDTRVEPSGTPYFPVLDIWMKTVRGPQGVSGYLADCPDVDMSTPMSIGQVLGFMGRYTPGGLQILEPISVGDIVPRPFTMPESSFSSYSGLAQRATIGSYQLPPCPFNWKPIVFGQLEAFGLNVSTNPLLIGAEVRVGDPTSGTLVARGFGNSLGQTSIFPHTSSPTTDSVAMTPTNNLGKVSANHSNPSLGTLYVNLFNDGAIGVYNFNPDNAQLFVIQMPV